MLMKFNVRTADTIEVNGRTLFRIQAMADIPGAGVKEGDLGGYIQHHGNLCQWGNCWIHEGSMVYDNAYVGDDAQIKGVVEIFGCATVRHGVRVHGSGIKISGYSVLTGTCEILDHVEISGNSKISGSAILAGSASIRDNSKVSGSSQIGGNAILEHNAEVSGNAIMRDHSRISHNGRLHGSASMEGYSHLSNNAAAGDFVRLCGATKLKGDVHVLGDAELYGNQHGIENTGFTGFDSQAKRLV
jgi:NDP-sugar pyrophosphorylase family protein